MLVARARRKAGTQRAALERAHVTTQDAKYKAMAAEKERTQEHRAKGDRRLPWGR